MADKCPYCGSDAVIKDSSIIYGKSYGDVLICTRYPACDAFVGVHKAGHYVGMPMGTMANAKLREMRKSLHALFDPLWFPNKRKRRECYQQLATRMGIPVEDCHMAFFNEEKCSHALTVVKLIRKENGLADIHAPPRPTTKRLCFRQAETRKTES